jgi:hypothetical protein
LDPIEKARSKFKKLLQDARARTQKALEMDVADPLKTITSDNATTWFRRWGYRGTAIMGPV